MYDSVSPSSALLLPVAGDMDGVRADSEVRLVLAANEAGTHVSRVFERGLFRARFPRGPRCEAVLLNTGGGITGGDRLVMHLTLDRGAAAVVTSQAAEKIYRSDGPPAVIAMTARLAEGTRLDWLPQETILFDRARLRRSIDIELSPASALTMLETVVLGRIAHGEYLTDASWHDAWRIKRGGRLIFAEAIKLEGAVSDFMQRPATGGGARAVATLLHVAGNAESRLADVRGALASASSLCAASAWNGMLVARFADSDPQALRRACSAAVTAISGAPMPRAWSC